MDSQEAAADDPGGTGTAVVEPKTQRERKQREVPRYHVLLWDSDDHSYEYVEKMLRELFGHTAEKCHEIAKTVDEHGKAIVLTTTKEHAELKRDQIIAYGKDAAMKDCKGSMHATIESAS